MLVLFVCFHPWPVLGSCFEVTSVFGHAGQMMLVLSLKSFLYCVAAVCYDVILYNLSTDKKISIQITETQSFLCSARCNLVWVTVCQSTESKLKLSHHNRISYRDHTLSSFFFSGLTSLVGLAGRANIVFQYDHTNIIKNRWKNTRYIARMQKKKKCQLKGQHVKLVSWTVNNETLNWCYTWAFKSIWFTYVCARRR